MTGCLVWGKVCSIIWRTQQNPAESSPVAAWTRGLVPEHFCQYLWGPRSSLPLWVSWPASERWVMWWCVPALIFAEASILYFVPGKLDFTCGSLCSDWNYFLVTSWWNFVCLIWLCLALYCQEHYRKREESVERMPINPLTKSAPRREKLKVSSSCFPSSNKLCLQPLFENCRVSVFPPSRIDLKAEIFKNASVRKGRLLGLWAEMANFWSAGIKQEVLEDTFSQLLAMLTWWSYFTS